MDIGSFGKTMRDFLIISNLMKLCKHDEILEFAKKIEVWQNLSSKIIVNNVFDNINNFEVKREIFNT